MGKINSTYFAGGSGGSSQELITVETKIGTVDVFVTPSGATMVGGLTDGSDTLVSPEFENAQVEIFLGNVPIPGYDQGDGGVYFTKVLSSDTITLSQPLATDDDIKIKIFGPIGTVSSGATPGLNDVTTVDQHTSNAIIFDGLSNGDLLLNNENGNRILGLENDNVQLSWSNGNPGITLADFLIGVNTTTPTNTFHVVGDIRFEISGTEGAGKVLTSDANGVATWETPSVSLDADLEAIAALGFTSTAFLKKTAANTWALDTTTYATDSLVVHLAGSESITGSKTATGSWNFNNTANGTANVTVSSGVQGVSDYQGLLVSGTYSPTTNAHPFRVNVTFSPSSNGLAIAALDAPLATSGTANMDHIVAFQGSTIHGSSGTLSIAYGGYSGFTNNGGVTTNRYGYYVANATGSGTLTNQYGYYAEDMTKGGTANYAFYAAGNGKLGLLTGIAEIGGSAIVGFGLGTAPGATLEVRKASTDASFRIRNNSNFWDFKATAGSTRLDISDVSGGTPYMSFFNGGFVNINSTTSNSRFYVEGSVGFKYTSNTNTSLTLNTLHCTVDNDATAGAITNTVPTAVGCAGRFYEIRKSDSGANTVTITGTSGQTFNGATSIVLYNQGDCVVIKSNGANWIVVSQRIGTLNISSAASLTLTYGADYVFTGTTTTWTLPAISSVTTGRFYNIRIKNRGTGAITLNTNGGGNTLYTTSAVNTLTINAGEAYTLMPDGTYLLIS